MCGNDEDSVLFTAARAIAEHEFVLSAVRTAQSWTGDGDMILLTSKLAGRQPQQSICNFHIGRG